MSRRETFSTEKKENPWSRVLFSKKWEEKIPPGHFSSPVCVWVCVGVCGCECVSQARIGTTLLLWSRVARESALGPDEDVAGSLSAVLDASRPQFPIQFATPVTWVWEKKKRRRFASIETKQKKFLNGKKKKFCTGLHRRWSKRCARGSGPGENFYTRSEKFHSTRNAETSDGWYVPISGRESTLSRTFRRRRRTGGRTRSHRTQNRPARYAPWTSQSHTYRESR